MIALLSAARVHAGRSGLALCLVLVSAASCGDGATDPDVEEPQFATPELPAPGTVDDAALELLAELTAAVGEGPGDAAAWRSLGEAYRAHARVPEARAVLGVATQLDATDAHAWYHYARAVAEDGDVEEALAALAEARRLAPDAGDLAWREGLWRLDLADLAAAEQCFREAAKLAPTHPEGALGLARSALEDGRPEEARTILEQMLRAELEDPYVHQLLGRALRELGDADGARSHAVLGAGATQLWRDDWETDLLRYEVGLLAVLEAARAMVEAGRATEALELLDGLEGLEGQDPADYRVVAARSAAYFVTGDLVRARSVLEEALAQGNDHYRIRLSLGLVVSRTEGPAPALVHVDAALVQNPDLGEAHFLRARLLRELGRDEEAVLALRATLARGERGLDVHHALGTTLLRLEDLDAAEEVYTRAALEHPAAARPHVMLARIYLTRGETAQVRGALVEARSRDPRHPLLPELEAGVVELEESGR